MRNRPILEARGLCKTFGRNTALQNVDFQAKRGEVIAVVGPSGSGKSTLLHCLAGILLPDDGEIWFEDRRLDRLTEAQRSLLRRTRFGFVFQFGQLIPELAAVENVALPLLLQRVARREALDRAEESLVELGIIDVRDRLPGDMSGGQAQRVALARALIIQPAVIFADEPTGSLDTEAGASVMAQLVGAAQGREATIILVTHDHGVAEHATRRFRLRDGRPSDRSAAS